MGKKNKKSKTKISNKLSCNNKYPFVSVCTPTFNRRPFIPGMLKCFNLQTYPKDRMEWIIVDDGTDKIGDLVEDHPNVKYFSYDTKMSLGKKRNLMHEKCSGEIIVYMDDDDYYPSERVSHAVEMLKCNHEALCAGCSEIYIFFKHIQKMYQFGPYGPNHGTAGTFAFKSKMLDDTRYDDEACLAEEKSFLKNYTIPFVQLEPKKTILCVSHEHNTFDKRKLLDNPHPQYCKESDKTVDNFIKDEGLKHFYMNIDKTLATYEPGHPRMKPDVLTQIAEIEEKRKKQAEEMLKNNNKSDNGQIMMADANGKQQPLSNVQVVDIIKKQQQQLQQQQQQLQQQQQQLQQQQQKLQQLQQELLSLKTTYDNLLKENIELKNKSS